MVCSQFPPRNGLKLEFVFFEAERDNDAVGISAPRRVVTFSASKRTNSNFKPFLWKLTKDHKSKVESIKKVE